MIHTAAAAVAARTAACAGAVIEYPSALPISRHADALVIQLDEKTERWVYLNDLAEQIEAQKNTR